MSSRGYDLSLYGQLNPGPGYGETFSFNVDGSLTAAMDGGLIDNRDAADEIELTFPQAVEGYTFAVRQVEDYPIKMLPYAGDTILGETDGYSIHSGEIVVFTVNDTGDWEIVTGGAPNIISPTYNVKRYGARGDGTTDDTVAFQTAMSKCTTRGSVVVVPETDDGALPGYIVGANIYDSLGTRSDSMPGTVMELGGRILSRAQWVLPGASRIIGRTSNNNTTTGGSSIRCTSTFPNDGTAIVRIGRAAGTYGWAGANDELADGSRIEWVSINGAGRGIHENAVVGVYSTSLQERSGLENCIISNVRTGVKMRPGTGNTEGPSNFYFTGVDTWINPWFDAVGFDIQGSNFTLEKCTTVSQYQSGFVVSGFADNGSGEVRLTLMGDGAGHPVSNGQRVKVSGLTGALAGINGTYLGAGRTTTTIDLAGSTYASPGASSEYTSARAYCTAYAGMKLGGANIRVVNGHCEFMEYLYHLLAQSGGGYWSYNHELIACHGYNGANHPILRACVRVGNLDSYSYNLNIEKFKTNLSNVVNFVRDDRNGITIPVGAGGANDLNLGWYRFGGGHERGINTTPIKVDTSYRNGRRTVSIAGGTTQNDYDLQRCKTLVVTVTGAGDVTFTSFTNGFWGDDFKIVNATGSVGNVIIDHAAATGTAANRVESATAADLTLAPVESAALEYGEGPTAYLTSISVSDATDNGDGLIRIESAGHGFSTGQQVIVANVGGVPNANGVWTITVFDVDNFDLDESTFSGTYTSGGTVRYKTGRWYARKQ